jgi:hypothetical protein
LQASAEISPPLSQGCPDSALRTLVNAGEISAETPRREVTMAAKTILVVSSIVALAIAAPSAYAVNSDSSPAQGGASSPGASTAPAKPHHHKHAKTPRQPQSGAPQQGG